MIDQIQKLIDDTKKNFEEYLANKNREELLPRLGELFDYKVQEVNHLMDVSLIFKDDVIFKEEISVKDFSDVPDKLKKSVRMIFNDGLTTKLNIAFNGENLFSEDLTIKDIKDIESVLQAHRSRIYQRVGKVNVTLVHNKNSELFSCDVRFTDLDDLIGAIKENEDLIYNKYIEPSKKDRQDFYGEGHSTSVVGELLKGNFIVDEFDNFIADENGNCLVW